MAGKRHCMICSALVFSGLFCSSCFAEMHRARTAGDQPFDEWLDGHGMVKNPRINVELVTPLDKFDLLDEMGQD